MTCTAYIVEHITTAHLVAAGWTEAAAWAALGRRDSAVVVSNPGYSASQTLDHVGRLSYPSSARPNDDIVAGAVGAYADEAAAQASIAAEAARIAADRAEEIADEAAWEALPEAEKARQVEQFAERAAVSRISPMINCRVTKATKSAIHQAAKARGESVSYWLRFAAMTAPSPLPPEPETADNLDENISLRLSVGDRQDFARAAYRAGLDPSDYLRRAIAARLAVAHGLPNTQRTPAYSSGENGQGEAAKPGDGKNENGRNR